VGGVAGMTINESKFSRPLKKIGGILIFLMPIFSVGYFFWVRFDIPLVFYVSNYKEIDLIGALVLSAGYFFTIIALIYARSSRKLGIRILGIILFVFTLPLGCLSMLLATPPTVLDKVQISNTTYYLTSVINVDGHYFRDLYKCTNNHFACEKTPFYSEGDTSVTHWRLMIDKTTDPNEINVIRVSSDGDEVLKYTYGAQPRYYDYSPAQLNDHLYYLSYPEDFTYYKPTIFTLYECKLDNTSCEKLPIQYTGIGRSKETIVDETTGEINVFIDDDQWGQDTLVFTWGEKPRCYVEGCEILEESE
jgi:hypothetical protein